MSLLDHELISQRYFFPRRTPLADAVEVEVDGATLACHAHRPHPNAPTLVHFHGNGEVVADYLPDFVESLAAVGLNTFFADQRGGSCHRGGQDRWGHLYAAGGDHRRDRHLAGRG